MSLTVYLEGPEEMGPCPDCTPCYSCDGDRVVDLAEPMFRRNITHNVNTMADEAGIYKPLWIPDEINIKQAKELIPLLEAGLENLKQKPDHYRKLNPSNGWGSYEGLVDFVEAYLAACREDPEASIRVSR